MSIVHFLNVKEGDCSIIEHCSGHVSVIDVCNARKLQPTEACITEAMLTKSSGNLKQKEYPVNPIEHMQRHNITSIFRFVLTHPDMDHMDGIKDLFEVFLPTNFYDTDNKKDTDFNQGSRYRQEDWDFYKNLRDTNSITEPKRLTLFSGDEAAYRTEDWDGNKPGDAFYVLAPTKELVDTANSCGDYNDCSYVVLYNAAGGKIVFGGDAHDKTWDHIIKTHGSFVEDIDLLIAPHHGRKSKRDYGFLDVLNPKMTFFGNASSEHLAYDSWNHRRLPYITNNQANCMIVNAGDSSLPIYVTNKNFAQQRNKTSVKYSDRFQGWFLQNIK